MIMLKFYMNKEKILCEILKYGIWNCDNKNCIWISKGKHEFDKWNMNKM